MSSKATPLFLIVLAAIVGYIAYAGLEIAGIPGLVTQKERVVAIRDTIAKLETETDKAKKELAKGTVEDLRKKLETYRSSLALLRRLVPDRNEVPNLLDDISTRSKIRGVTLSQVVPQPVENGPAPFDTYRYTLSVIGHYDQIGEWLADVASLQRIIVPQDVSLSVANQAAAKALGDTSGALLEAKLQIRTFVKSGAGAPEGESSGT
ncbi:MAG TPA: type 4a pilus biogenesis protein PilO [Gemmatimonadales bacterium]|jgi:type IV pilus assembly protein PilO|nr:type 4a pilus biogenesis protein PilO [Gemmatimonadales bacterium]